MLCEAGEALLLLRAAKQAALVFLSTLLPFLVDFVIITAI